jgi:cyclopropane-fatty-acyl-phospholipid synthase
MNLIPISLAKTLFLRSLAGLRGGELELVSDGETHRFGDAGPDGLRAQVVVHDERFFRRAVLGGDVALGEAWMDGDWSSPDLVSVVRVAVRNLGEIENRNRWLSAARRGMDVLRHRSRGNSIQGSRRNIRAHYDLSNDFFRLFLDQSMMYSCAFYEGADDSIERAQFNKLDRICRKLSIGPGDSVLEIGTGWGGFAEHAVRQYGCHVTTTTISREQHDYARERFESAGLQDRVELLFEDYRNLRGQYSRIVSIEMFEAVGLEHYDDFFGACDRLLEPDGAMLLQTITMNERTFPSYRGRADWIQKYVFPGSELASVAEILKSLARGTRLAMQHAEDIGLHYARTLAEWRERFHGAIDSVRSLGFDDRFVRMWDYYLAYCEGAFRERHIGDFQLVLTKAAVHRLAGLPPETVSFASEPAI